MRTTCLRCGHQRTVDASSAKPGPCLCGEPAVAWIIYDTGVRPNRRAAERSRSRAFQAAGVVRNLGGFALGVSLLGLLCFPLGLAGAALGAHGLYTVRGPHGRYSGRGSAIWAMALGLLIFVGEGGMVARWLWREQLRERQAAQITAAADLTALLRAELQFRAVHGRYGTFAELEFQPRYGRYTLHLSKDQIWAPPGRRPEALPALLDSAGPLLEADSFRALAVGDIDGDAGVDLWAISERGTLVHLLDDLAADGLPKKTGADAGPAAH